MIGWEVLICGCPHAPHQAFIGPCFQRRLSSGDLIDFTFARAIGSLCASDQQPKNQSGQWPKLNFTTSLDSGLNWLVGNVLCRTLPSNMPAKERPKASNAIATGPIRLTPRWLLINLERKLERDYGGFMSVVGTKQTCSLRRQMSASGGRADVDQAA
jgi:hypothetical protein